MNPPVEAGSHADRTQRIVVGPLTFDVTIARTAQVFYLVDQISNWTVHTHTQYAHWAEEQRILGDRERSLLEQHKHLREATRGYGPLESAFVSTLSIAAAADRARLDGILSAEDARTEASVLQGFEPIVKRYLDDAQPRLEAFCDRLKEQANTIGPFLSDVQAFAGTYTPLPIPLFVAFSPTPGGGGYNGGIAWVEVGDSYSALDTFMQRPVCTRATFVWGWRFVPSWKQRCPEKTSSAPCCRRLARPGTK